MANNEGETSRWESSKTEECIEFEYDWTINSFLEVAKLPREEQHSPNFGGPTKLGGIECKLVAVVYPAGENKACEDYVSTCLLMDLQPPDEVMVQYEVSILAAVGQKLETKTIDLNHFKWSWEEDFILSCIMEVLQSELKSRRENFIPLKELRKQQDKYLPNGNLTLHYEGKVWITLDSSKEKDLSEKTSPDSYVTTMIMKNLFESGNYSDVTIKAGSREFKCHKCVLSIRSEYFRAMFESGTKESQEGIVDFSDQMDGDVLEDLLKYLYFGMTSNLKKTCQKMLTIADVFQLDGLKSQSEEELIVKLSPGNALDIAVLAREQGAKKLLKKAISFSNKCL